MTLMGLLVFIIVIGLLYYIVTLLPLPAPFKTIAIVVVLLVAVLYLVSALSGGSFLNIRIQ